MEASLDGWLTTGRFNELFEKKLAEFIGLVETTPGHFIDKGENKFILTKYGFRRSKWQQKNKNYGTTKTINT